MSTQEVIAVPLDQLVPDPDQPRKQFSEESLLGLAATMAEGQLQPILAYERDGKLVILDGERRWRAARMAKLVSVEVRVVDRPSAAVALEKALIANLQREDLGPIEKARAIKRLRYATGWSASQVSRRLGLSPGNISRLEALLKLPDEVQDRVQRGELSASAAYQVSLAPSDEQASLAVEAAEHGLGRDALAARVKKGRKPSPAPPKAPSRCIAKLRAGRSISVSGPGLVSLDVLIEWLEELLGKARKARPRGMELSTFLALLRDEAKVSANGEAPNSRKGGKS